MKINNLQVNNSKITLGIDTGQPLFSWLNETQGSCKGQSAYRIIVSSSKENVQNGIGDLWDSYKIKYENNYDIAYGGKPLKSKTQYFWSVQVWDERDEDSFRSEIAEFETGIMDQKEWKAKWIGRSGMKIEDRYSVLLRKEVCLKNKLQSARAYISGLGLYELKINGETPDDTLLNPAHTQYEKSVFYNVYDVTKQLIQNNNNANYTNIVTVELGHGFYNETFSVWNWQTAVWRDNPKVIMELTLNYADGTTETLITDETWKTAIGPVNANSIYFGEVYDAGSEKNGFELPGYNDKDWENAVAVKAPEGRLIFQNMEPIRKTNVFEPEIKKLDSGAYLIINPVMTAGWIKVTARAEKGGAMDISYGEKLLDNGELKKVVAWKCEIQRDRYIFKGNESETFEPRFSYKGYKYVQIDGFGNDFKLEEVVCYGIHNDVEHISTFESGDELVNKLHDIQKRTILNNFHGKPSDTPVFEKNGWAGDVNVTAETICYNFDVRSFMSQYMNDLKDAQLENGIVPVIAPTAAWGLDNHPVWNTVYVFVMQHLYDFFGMNRFADIHYDSMKHLLSKIIADMNPDKMVWELDRLGDWISPTGDNLKSDRDNPPEGGGITNTAFIYKALEIMADIALRKGMEKDSVYYKDIMKKIYTKFNETFYKPEKGIYETNIRLYESDRTQYRQTDQLVAIAFGLVPEEHFKVVTENLEADVKKKLYHLDTGVVGTKLILPVLSDLGYKDIAYKILTQETYPSWGFWVTEYEATTTWESYEIVGRSHNHFFFGTYDEWLFKGLAGIRDIKDGYKTFTIKPQIIEKLGYVKVSLNTPRGRMESNWKVGDDGTVEIGVVVPAGSTAEVYIPENLKSDKFMKNTVKSGTYKWKVSV